MINLNNLFSKPATPDLTFGKPTAKHPGELSQYGPFHIRREPCEFVCHFLDVHLPSSASVWSVDLILV